MKKRIEFPYKLFKGEFYPIIKVVNVSFKATIGFSSHLGADFNLLGQKDIFDSFVVSFDRQRKIISFNPY